MVFKGEYTWGKKEKKLRVWVRGEKVESPMEFISQEVLHRKGQPRSAATSSGESRVCGAKQGKEQAKTYKKISTEMQNICTQKALQGKERES